MAQGDDVASGVIAKELKISMTTPKFFYLAASSRDYGLSTGGRHTPTMTLTELGKQIVHTRTPVDEHQAKIKAFLTVEPFAKLFQIHKRLSDLPQGKYLTNLLSQDLKLPEAQHEDFMRLVKENCTYLVITDSVDTSTLPLPPATDDGKPSRAIAIRENPLAFVIMPLYGTQART